MDIGLTAMTDMLRRFHVLCWNTDDEESDDEDDEEEEEEGEDKDEGIISPMITSILKSMDYFSNEPTSIPEPEIPESPAIHTPQKKKKTWSL